MAARVVLQKGHCWRKTGATGTEGEQALNSSVCDLAAAKLRAYGHTTRVILADEVYTGPAEVFIAHHADGSENRSASGASVGYPDIDGGRLAHQFKIAYTARSWPYGWRADNYTAGLRGYYAYSRHDHITRRMVIEAGFMTNPTRDRPWINGHHGTIAQAIADAVNAIYGSQEDDMNAEQDQMLRDIRDATSVAKIGGAVLQGRVQHRDIDAPLVVVSADTLVVVQDLAEQLNELTAKVDALTAAHAATPPAAPA